VGLPPGEPHTRAAVDEWVEAANRQLDPFDDVRQASHEHRASHGHGCTVFPTSSGTLLSALAAGVGARRLLEIGCGLGYSALCLAYGAGPHAQVETIERDEKHAALAAEIVDDRGFGSRISIVVGSAHDVLPGLGDGYDVVFCDADPPGYAELLDELLRLVRPGGLVVSANLFLAQFDAGIPGLAEIAEYRTRLLECRLIRTSFLPAGMAVSIRRSERRRPAA
jgi:predicted O-methyltransferase YrrM